MSNEKASQLSINIGNRVRYYVIYFAIVILCLIWGNEILNLIKSSIANDPQKSEWAQKSIESIIVVLGAGAFLVMNLGRDINLHNLIDGLFFHVRRNTNAIIQREMIKEARRIGAYGWENMERSESEVTKLFYHFVNNQEALRSLAFTYWEQYFVNIYILFLGTVFFLVSTLWVCLRWEFDVVAFTPAIFLFIVSVVALSTRYSLLPKIYGLPVQQIGEISNSNTEEFKEQVRTRFGGSIISTRGQ